MSELALGAFWPAVATTLQSDAATLPPESAEFLAGGMAALAVGIAAYGAGVAERGIGSAAVGAMAENEDLFVRGLILTVLPETLVILALVAIFLA